MEGEGHGGLAADGANDGDGERQEAGVADGGLFGGLGDASSDEGEHDDSNVEWLGRFRGEFLACCSAI